MKRDLWGALAVCLVVIAIGYFALISKQNAEYDDVSAGLRVAETRMEDDRVFIASYPQREKVERERMAAINALDITATGDLVERRFLLGLHDLIKRRKLGVRPLSLAETFSADAPQRGAAPAPALGASPGTATPANASTMQGALAPAPAAPGTIASGSIVQTSDIATSPDAPRPLPAAVLMKNAGTLDLVGPYSSVLQAVSDLSGMPLLFEVNDAILTRETNDASKNPPIDLKLSFTLYRVEASP